MAAPDPNASQIAGTIAEFERNLEKLEAARPFAKAIHQARLFSLAWKLLRSDEGVASLYAMAPRFDPGGLFDGGDWEHPRTLEPGLVRGTITGEGMFPPLECLNQLRFLAIANGEASHPELSPEAARSYLEEVLARNLDLSFPEATEFTRQSEATIERLRRVFSFVLERLGAGGVIGALATECDRVMLQRPIMAQRVEDMLRSAARVMSTSAAPGQEHERELIRWMTEALEGPTELARRHPEPAAYADALAGLGPDALSAEAAAFGQRMDKSGLVSRNHATLLRFLADSQRFDLLADGLALNPIGRTSLTGHAVLVTALVQRAVLPDTARCIYGLSRLLNRGILFFPPVPPALQRLMLLDIHPEVARLLQAASQVADPPDPGALLLSGTLSVIGQPRGVDQGHNPTCQAARAISLWSQNDVGYLLDLIARAASDNDLVMHFEGSPIRASELKTGLAEELHTELDPVSLVLTPHLDKIYMEMSRRTIGRGEDGHKWVNPEFHGWWVYRGFASLVHAITQGVHAFDNFVRCFYASYHPECNGGRQLVYAQPCGVASTGPNAEFVGWHALSIQRVAQDPGGVWRVYFFNPNRDKGQNWGQEIVTSTCNHGEFEGESSLPFEQFLMRLYVFHFDESELGDTSSIPPETVERIRAAVAQSWAAGRVWLD